MSTPVARWGRIAVGRAGAKPRGVHEQVVGNEVVFVHREVVLDEPDMFIVNTLFPTYSTAGKRQLG